MEDEKIINVIGDSVSTRMNEPLVNTDEFYFEIIALSNLDSSSVVSSVNVGFEVHHAHGAPLSIMMCNSGKVIDFVDNSPTSNESCGFGTGDVVGCLWTFMVHQNFINVLFSVNGVPANHYTCVVEAPGKLSVYPSVTLIGVGTSVRVNLGDDPFKYHSETLSIRTRRYSIRPPELETIRTCSDIWTEDDSERVRDGLALLEGVLASYQQSFQNDTTEKEFEDNMSAYRDIMLNIKDALKSLQIKLLNAIRESEVGTTYNCESLRILGKCP